MRQFRYLAALCSTLIFLNTSLELQAQVHFSLDVSEVRSNFLVINTESELETFLVSAKTDTAHLTQAYYGAAKARMAEFVFAPWTKYSYFQEGVRKIEHSIKTEPSLDNHYLRLIIQLNCPEFLGYNSNIKNDFAYLNSIKNWTNVDPDQIRLMIESLSKARFASNYDKQINNLKQLFMTTQKR